jgi:hypothetical protein
MKRVLLSLLLVVCFVTPSWGQDGLINPDQIANTIPTVIQAGESLTAGELCKIINDGGFKAYKYISHIVSSPTYLLTGGTYNNYISATRMTDTTAIIAFTDGGDANKGKAVVATISGGTISCSSSTYLISGGTNNYDISATRMTDTTAIIAFQDAGDSSKGKAVVATISGGTITCSAMTYLISGGTANNYISATRMTDTTAIIAFTDGGDSSKGKSIIYTIPPTYLLPAISNNAVTSGNTGTFSILKPYTKITNSGFAFTGAQPYFISASNTWTTTPTNYYVGYALDTTSIMIDGAYYTNAINQTVGNSTLPVSLIRK